MNERGQASLVRKDEMVDCCKRFAYCQWAILVGCLCVFPRTQLLAQSNQRDDPAGEKRIRTIWVEHYIDPPEVTYPALQALMNLREQLQTPARTIFADQ